MQKEKEFFTPFHTLYISLCFSFFCNHIGAKNDEYAENDTSQSDVHKSNFLRTIGCSVLFHHHGLQEKDRKERGSKTDIFTSFELRRLKFPDADDIGYCCNDIDECRKSNDVEQERIARMNLVIMMTDIDDHDVKDKGGKQDKDSN